MLRVEWSIKALIDFDAAQGYIARQNPAAARAVAERIWQAGRQLSEAPYIGHPGLEPGTRHWNVQRTPYLIVYRVSVEAVEILRMWHGRRDWTREHLAVNEVRS
jgi:plasmid stabilization system protein ParE